MFLRPTKKTGDTISQHLQPFSSHSALLSIILCILTLFCNRKKLRFSHIKTIHYLRRKFSTLSCMNHPYSLIYRKRSFVYSFTYKRIIYINYRHHLRPYRNFFPFQTIRITFSIIFFMVMPAYILTITIKIASIIDRFKHFASIYCMLLHNFEFILCQPVRLKKYIIRYCYFTKIMQC